MKLKRFIDLTGRLLQHVNPIAGDDNGAETPVKPRPGTEDNLEANGPLKKDNYITVAKIVGFIDDAVNRKNRQYYYFSFSFQLLEQFYHSR
ncbi:hypothetical protein C2E25_09445 [Geothermobacter hydrogeniphilus]|uniref:Uncharacterized protein n=1 Tax=Geothermobacter hydrogeniphilus TaxID=1969733 RepID=A0A2K2H9U5_9BACT|nr:hypothetical protein [Geothermobacter hydrogeniphilus]PNU20003.1 hypothetical protein C2E25_09445 [Geothermobacter hydrogeniphilus]